MIMFLCYECIAIENSTIINKSLNMIPKEYILSMHNRLMSTPEESKLGIDRKNGEKRDVQMKAMKTLTYE